MHLSAYLLLVASLLFALFFSGAAAAQLWQGRSTALPWIEKAHLMLTGFMTLSSVVLLHALVNFDFSLVYVASYTDRALPLFYRMTAFWAGQAGSMLFWGWSVALFGVIFALTGGYRDLSPQTKLWYWLFFLAVMAFFLLILTAWSNPFLTAAPAPADGNGLNPLLQNPGMIFHPPLLFLGYGGFAIPGCLALAQAMSNGYGREGAWAGIARPFTLTAWLFLTAGIVLGGWWSYMELGWGGYWAWDPVENASLIPWLVSTAFLHTSVIESRRGKLHRVNILLMALTTISAFFATYLVRSGVVDSLHAFGDGGVGRPLLIFILASIALTVAVTLIWRKDDAKPLSGIDSREGFLVLVAWVLLALSAIILVATMWPVFSKFWVEKPMGLEPAFYNRVCLPLFAGIAVLLSICPWLGWKGGVRSMPKLLAVLGVMAAVTAMTWYAYRMPMAALGAGAGAACVAGIVILLTTESHVRRNNASLAAHGVHLGLALMVLGVAFSGPYKIEQEVEIPRDATVKLGKYDLRYVNLYEGEGAGYIFIEAELNVTREGSPVGVLSPQRRLYAKFDRQAYAEAATIFGLGDELYATLLGVDAEGAATLKVSVNPLVNWVWIGGTLMCIAPFLGLRRPSSSRDEDDDTGDGQEA